MQKLAVFSYDYVVDIGALKNEDPNVIMQLQPSNSTYLANIH